jgi:Rrf2 family transcriptional regulator, iron-sulfur cluster assembly transcription factor
VRLEVTRKSDLAVRTLRTLAGLPPGRRAKGPELAASIGSTPGFVAQVMTPLVRVGWVTSEPGPTGGYSLRVDLTTISVLAVVEAIEGPTDTGRCVLADRPCSEEGPCALHAAWQRARQELLRELDSMSVCDVDARTWSPGS